MPCLNFCPDSLKDELCYRQRISQNKYFLPQDALDHGALHTAVETLVEAVTQLTCVDPHQLDFMSLSRFTPDFLVHLYNTVLAPQAVVVDLFIIPVFSKIAKIYFYYLKEKHKTIKKHNHYFHRILNRNVAKEEMDHG